MTRPQRSLDELLGGDRRGPLLLAEVSCCASVDALRSLFEELAGALEALLGRRVAWPFLDIPGAEPSVEEGRSAVVALFTGLEDVAGAVRGTLARGRGPRPWLGELGEIVRQYRERVDGVVSHLALVERDRRLQAATLGAGKRGRLAERNARWILRAQDLAAQGHSIRSQAATIASQEPRQKRKGKKRKVQVKAGTVRAVISRKSG